jgi:hypothetical protein
VALGRLFPMEPPDSFGQGLGGASNTSEQQG